MNWQNLQLPAVATRTGAEYHFPCLVTGEGKDRAWVNPDAQLLGCRGCGGPDGGLEGDDLRTHAEVLGIWDPPGAAAGAQQTVYVYENAAGARVFDVVRFEEGPGQKTFRQRHGPAGSHVWRRPAAARGLLYRLPAVVAAIQAGTPILIVEGEKDVDRLAGLGVTATCNAGGAGKFTREHAQHRAGAADVRIVPDDDTPGREHATRVVEQLATVGVTATVLAPWMADGETKADISDWIAANPGCDAAAVLALPVRQAALPPAQAPVPDPPAQVPAGSPAVYDERSLADAYLASVTEDGLVTRRYDVTREQWYVWEQGWKPTDTVTREIADLGRRIYARTPSKSVPQATPDPRTGGKRATARGAELFAGCAPGVLTPPSAWDASPYVIGLTDGRVLEYRVAGGEVDVVVRNESPDDLIRTRTGILPCPADAFETSRVAEFLLEILPAGLLPFLQRFLGAGAIAADGLDRVGFLYGPGGSGKTTLIEGVLAALGGDTGYGVSCLASHLMVNAAGSHETRLARLAGKRVIVATEIAQAATLDEAILKDLSGGGTMSARFVRRDAFQFRHRGIVCLVGNNAPRLRARDSGILRRLLVFPFTHQPAKVDPSLRPALRDRPEARAAWLRWLCEGARDYLRDGLGEVPSQVTAETTRYSETADPLSEFVNDFVTAAPGRTVPTKEVHRAYLQWASERGEDHPLHARAFNAALAEGFGFKRDRSNGSRIWRDVALRDESGTSGTQDAPTF